VEYTIAHETSYVYPKSVHESYTVVHLQPRSDQSQFCSKYELRVQPESSPLSYVDRFGNDVQHFAILPAHDALSITTRSHVVTLPSSEPTRPAAATRALLETDRKVPRFYDFLHDSAYVRAGPELDDFVAELEPPGERIGAWCLDLAAAIHRGFAYDRTATNVRTAVAGALAARAGVCQDFAARGRHSGALCQRVHLWWRLDGSRRRGLSRLVRGVPPAVWLGGLRPDERPLDRRLVRARGGGPGLRRRQPGARDLSRRRRERDERQRGDGLVDRHPAAIGRFASREAERSTEGVSAGVWDEKRPLTGNPGS